MQINSLTFGGPGADASGETKGPQEEFLKLLVAQMENQDPMSPQDSTAFVAQLAQFASLEQAAETNTRLANLEAVQGANLRSGFSNLVGKTVTAKSDTIELPRDPSSPAKHYVELERPVAEGEIIVRDSNGREVYRQSLDGKPPGKHVIEWDGRSAGDEALPEGSYQIEVVAEDSAGEKLEIDSYVQGVVRALDFADGNVQLFVGALKLTPADIKTIEA